MGRSDEDARDDSRSILGGVEVHPTIPVVEAWSVQRVATLLHVSESTVRRLIAAAAFPGAFRVGRKLVRIRSPISTRINGGRACCTHARDGPTRTPTWHCRSKGPPDG